jgi:tetratricopeptide (TPR) repeat protein/predicted Ser/Thr protein kinase
MNGLVGRRLGRYEIVSLIGSGGMGEVYRARDVQLGRDVAVKVLGAKALEDPSRLERFEKEARAVALLSHPNILDIHDFGEDGGVAYAVTELLEGKNLRERMEGTSLPLSKALEIGREVAEGLAAAHGKGIVHRDLKPENIFITSTGQVKILDFGIARLKGRPVPDPLDASTPTATSTVTGPVMGTVGYMSPEQVRGLPPEARSDIFSLGCVLYEMVIGQRPFRGETVDDTMLAILHRDPPPMTGARADVPPALALVVGRCLEKQPEERFESARDVAFALQAISVTRETVVVETPFRRGRGSRAARAGGIALAALVVAALVLFGARRWVFGPPALPKEKHLAVTRFEADGKVRNLQEIAEGLTEVLERELAVLEEASPGSFWAVPRREADSTGLKIRAVQDMGSKFNVTAVVTGRLLGKGDRLRLDLAAVEPSSERVLRRTTIEDSVGNLAAFQEEPVVRVARMLDLPVNAEARERLKASGTTIATAFEPYLEGTGALAGAKDEAATDRAIGFFETATARDPLFALGRIALGQAYLRKFGFSKKPEWADRAQAEAERAAKESRWPCEAYRLLGAVNGARDRRPEALAALEQAVRLAPSSAAMHLELAHLYQVAKRFGEAEQEFERAIFLRPGYWLPHHLLAQLYREQGKYEAAANQDREAVACAPQLTRNYNNLGAMYFYLGRFDDARDVFERSLAIEPSRSALSNLGTLYFESTRYADAATMYERALKLDDTRYLTWGNLAYTYKFGVAPDKAEGCFRRAVELGEKAREASPRDPRVLADLASYYAMLDQRERGLVLLEQALAENPKESQLIALVAETFEDLGDRNRALDWVARSFEAGVSPSRFEGRPTLRGLVADERYRRLADERRRSP